MPPPSLALPSPSLFAELRELSFKRSKSHSAISTAFQSVELDAQDLETFISQELPQHLESTNINDYNGGIDSALFRNLQHQVRQLSRHAQQSKINNNDKDKNDKATLTCDNHPHCSLCCPEFIAEIILSLQSVIESTPSLSATVTAEIHSMIGLLRHKKRDQQGAIRSFLRVLWILSSTKSTPTILMCDHSLLDNINNNHKTDGNMLWKMGLTRHRLAMAFGSTGNLTDAVRLLEQALRDYNEHQNNASSPSLVKHHKSVVEQAETDLQLAKLLLERQQRPRKSQSERRIVPVRRSATMAMTTATSRRAMGNQTSMRRSSSA